MANIRILPKNLANQIAAGEVIERPASVVKELVENALDAQATEITINLDQGGKERIEIIDNGIGMSAEDAALSLLRFATSKIKDEDDLFNIRSLGFRGEALPSISSVAIVTLQTKQNDSLPGTEIRIKGGELLHTKEVAANVGTRIVVEHLFFNIPARKKYLKSDSTELSHIVDYVTQIALSHPEVGFTLNHNNRKVFQLPRRDQLLSRIQDLFSENTENELLTVVHAADGISLTGFVAHPKDSKPTSKYEFLFINQRPVKNQAIRKAIMESYGRLLERGAYPFYVLLLEIDPHKVDVNVHPRKLEVRFEETQRIYRFFQDAVMASLTGSFLTPEGNGPMPENISPTTEPFMRGPHGTYSSHAAPRSPYAFHIQNPAQSSFAQSSFAPVERGSLSVQNQSPSTQLPAYFKRVLGQIHNAYILCETAKGFVSVDQHAAHEIILFQQFKLAHTKQQAVTQKLLTPAEVQLPANTIHLWQQHEQLLAGLGFETQLSGKQSLLVLAVPSDLKNADISKLILDLLAEVNESSQQSDNVQKEKMYATMACRAAVKFGDPLSLPEQEQLLRRLEELDAGYSCPHGRPVLKEFNLTEMLRWFKR